jgi:hypothetical protein
MQAEDRNSSSCSDESESGDDESEERVLGSDEDEQEDPRDYEKGRRTCSFSS